jgi:hypothetical protein
MKLVIQNIDGTYYAYREKERHYAKVAKKRGGVRLDPRMLDEECNLHETLPPGTYMVFDIKR